MYSDEWQRQVNDSIAALDNTDKALAGTLNAVDKRHSKNAEAFDSRLARLESQQRPVETTNTTNGNLQEFLWRLTSRKFLGAVATAFTAIIGMFHGSVSPDVGMSAISAVIIAFIAAEGYADAQERKNQ